MEVKLNRILYYFLNDWHLAIPNVRTVSSEQNYLFLAEEKRQREGLWWASMPCLWEVADVIAVPLLACSMILDTMFCVLPLSPLLQVRRITAIYFCLKSLGQESVMDTPHASSTCGLYLVPQESRSVEPGGYWVSAALAECPRCSQSRCLGWPKVLSRVGGFSANPPPCPPRCEWCPSTTSSCLQAEGSFWLLRWGTADHKLEGQTSAPLCLPCHGGVARAARAPQGEPQALQAWVEGFGCGRPSEFLHQCWFI